MKESMRDETFNLVFENEKRKDMKNISMWYNLHIQKLRGIENMILSNTPKQILDIKIKDVPGMDKDFLSKLDEISINHNPDFRSKHLKTIRGYKIIK